jgi:phasin family protein
LKQTQLTVTAPTAKVEDNVVKQADLVKAAYEKNVANARELRDILTKVTTETSDILSRRVVAGLDEIKAAAQQPKVAERTLKAA